MARAHIQVPGALQEGATAHSLGLSSVLRLLTLPPPLGVPQPPSSPGKGVGDPLPSPALHGDSGPPPLPITPTWQRGRLSDHR